MTQIILIQSVNYSSICYNASKFKMVRNIRNQRGEPEESYINVNEDGR